MLRTLRALRELRVAAGLSLQDLADRSGVNKGTISQIERGRIRRQPRRARRDRGRARQAPRSQDAARLRRGRPVTGLADMTEKEWAGQVAELCRFLGWRRYHTYRSERSPAGFPDETLVRDRVVFLELKTEKGRLSAAQKDWLGALLDAGAEAYVVRPGDLDDLSKILSGRIAFRAPRARRLAARSPHARRGRAPAAACSARPAQRWEQRKGNG